MKGTRFRIYVDTSVIGGCLDAEFSKDSNRLLQAAKKGHIVFVVSEVVLEELEEAPDAVKAQMQLFLGTLRTLFGLIV